MTRQPKLATVGDRIRGCIAIALCIGSFTAANYATDQRWLGVFMICGFFYMLTSIAIVFKNFD